MPFAPLLRVRGNKTRTRAEQRRMSIGTQPNCTDIRRLSAVGLGQEKRLSLGNIAEGQGSILNQLQSSHSSSLQVANGPRTSHRRFSVVTRMDEQEEEEPPKIFGFPAKTIQILMVIIILIISSILIFLLPSQPSETASSGTSNEQSTFSDDTNGGWRTADYSINVILNSNICSIERISLNSLTDEDFNQHYRFKWPLLITFPEGAASWTDPQQWTLTNLKRQYGTIPVLSGKSFDIVRSGGSGHLRSSLAEFVDHIMNQKDDNSEPLYIFDRNFYTMSGLPKTVHPPSFLKASEGSYDSIFFLGTSGSGVSFHKHSDAWNGVIYGRKRWFLYPPHKTPPGGVWPGFGAWDWFQKVYPTLDGDNKPLECIQEAGEIMYIPESFYHNILNLGDTVAIGIQDKEPTTKKEKLFYAAQKLERINADSSQLTRKGEDLLAIFEELHQLLPDNTEVLLRLGRAFQDLDRIDQAIIHTKRALDIDPKFVTAHLNLASLYSSQGNLFDAELHYRMALDLNDHNWDIYAQFGDFLLNKNRPSEAVEMYQKGTKLSSDTTTFWKRLGLALQQSGDSEQTVINKLNQLKDEL